MSEKNEVEFFTVSSEKRPVRLCDETRRFAYDSLENHKYGKDTKEVLYVTLDEITDYESMTSLKKYDAAIREIAKQSRVRICPGERVSGSATLGYAIQHVIPAVYKGGCVGPSVSHLTLDFDTVVSKGISSLEDKALRKISEPGLTEGQREFLESCVSTFESMHIWHKRYTDTLRDMPEYAENYKNLMRVPFSPASSFYEAVQSLWFTFAFTRLCGNWPGIGRIDKILGPYLKKDLLDNTLTLDEAREILSHFMIKGCEWVSGGNYGSGDAQHYQNIVLSGIDEDGCDVTNEVTYLVLDIFEELNISDFPTTVRLNSHSEEKLLRRVAQVMKHGGGVLAVYNEDKVIEAMTSHGYSLSEARSFANDGCWEVQVPGKTYFTYIPFDGLQILLNNTLHLDGEPATFQSMDELYEAYFSELRSFIDGTLKQTLISRTGAVPGKDWHWSPSVPCTVVSLFEGSCIDKAASYFEGGTDYTVVSPHIGGGADVGNALLAIDRLCFKDKTLSFDGFMQILKNNWEGEETLRQYVRNSFTYYGNDDDLADSYTSKVIDTFAKIVLEFDSSGKYPIRFVPGVSTFGRQIDWRNKRTASPHGHKSGDVLAPNMSATPGSDLSGATALIKSYCKLKHSDQVTGAALDLKLLCSSVKGEEGTDALIGLMRGFVTLGGFFMQPDVVDNSVLLDAQKHPEQYQSLSVRVSGWNARFVTLDKEWQDMCIEKSTHGEL